MIDIRRCMITSATLVMLASTAPAKGIAFQPVVGAIPNGPTLGVTPAVSIDRRYVRLGVNAQFIGVEGFNTYLVPGAVGGGPGGPGALGGLGLGAVVGGQFFAGMDGAIYPMSVTGLHGMPQGDGLNGDQAPAHIAPPEFVGMSPGPQMNRPAATRSGVSKTLRRGKNSRAKQPAGATTSRAQSKRSP